MEEVGVVGFGQFFQVIELHLFFVSDVSRFDSLEKDLRLGLEIDDEIRGRDASPEELKDLFIEDELVSIEVQKGKEPVLVEKVVGDRNLIEEIRLGYLLLLTLLASLARRRTAFDTRAIRRFRS